jgi:hypothetical protein
MKRAMTADDMYKFGQLAERMKRLELKIAHATSKTAWDFVTAQQSVTQSIEKSNV